MSFRCRLSGANSSSECMRLLKSALFIVSKRLSRLRGDLSPRFNRVILLLSNSSPSCVAGRHDNNTLSLSLSLCILLTLAAVSLPQCNKNQNGSQTHTLCALWCIGVLNQHTVTHMRNTQEKKKPMISRGKLLNSL